ATLPCQRNRIMESLVSTNSSLGLLRWHHGKRVGPRPQRLLPWVLSRTQDAVSPNPTDAPRRGTDLGGHPVRNGLGKDEARHRDSRERAQFQSGEKSRTAADQHEQSA